MHFKLFWHFPWLDFKLFTSKINFLWLFSYSNLFNGVPSKPLYSIYRAALGKMFFPLKKKYSKIDFSSLHHHYCDAGIEIARARSRVWFSRVCVLSTWFLPPNLVWWIFPRNLSTIIEGKLQIALKDANGPQMDPACAPIVMIIQFESTICRQSSQIPSK